MRKDRARLAVQVLKLLDRYNVVVTGSLILKEHKIIDREVKDLDLLTDDIGAVEELMRNCIDISETTRKGHYRFLYKDKLFVDIFLRDEIPNSEVDVRLLEISDELMACTSQQVEGIILQKLVNLSKDGTLNGRQRKSIDDIKDYIITQRYSNNNN